MRYGWGYRAVIVRNSGAHTEARRHGEVPARCPRSSPLSHGVYGRGWQL
ncbi:MAG: hypothetical protein AVDCRST_MAG68-3198 [uncultured Gemmatimonadetes bacterium]|uniref:Uncharacterized protein n=1 Tax=uncultured Gemmatimonadota bacterium TaxID=203437 RepID=A0A6J4LY69_9BACT|nr:MAG: hypothetical protein AVDCRST_MAG68-3198 [uncultured Gemmatimonadota bacterium]